MSTRSHVGLEVLVLDAIEARARSPECTLQRSPECTLHVVKEEFEDAIESVHPPVSVYEYEPKQDSEACEEPSAPQGGGIRRYCRIWYILGAILLGLIVIIAVLGALLGRNTRFGSPATETFGQSLNSSSAGSSTSNSSISSSTSPNSSTISGNNNNNTGLATVAWTDINSVLHTQVFYQDINNMIRASSWNATDARWHQSSVGLALAKDGSPLAAAINSSFTPNTINLFFLNPEGQADELVTTDGIDWQNGSLNTQNIFPANNSRLAAAWARNTPHREDPHSLLLIYQDASGEFQLWNSTSDVWTSSIIPANPIIGSGMSLSSTFLPRMPSQLSLWYQLDSGNLARARWLTTAQLEESDTPVDSGYQYGNTTHAGWNTHEADPLGAFEKGAPLTSFVFGRSAHGNVTGLPTLIECLMSGSSGVITTEWVPQMSSQFSVPSMPAAMSEVSNFSALASHKWGSVYAVVGGGVMEFKIHPTTYNWYRQSQVVS